MSSLIDSPQLGSETTRILRKNLNLNKSSDKKYDAEALDRYLKLNGGLDIKLVSVSKAGGDPKSKSFKWKIKEYSEVGFVLDI